ncbi:cytochrome P450 [Aspergillus multicolor]|uniref:cytochrome P450 n=1 Tax=Aspergillus multicolor TaxID=41759 RepID=UPI003CCCA9A7
MNVSNTTSTLRPDLTSLSAISFEGNHLPILGVALLTIIVGTVYLDGFSTKYVYGLKGIPTIHRSRMVDAYRSGVWWRIFIPRLECYLREGYYKYNKHDKPFRIWLSGPQTYTYMLPYKFLERVKNLGNSEVSFIGIVDKYFAADFPTKGINTLVIQVVSKLMNANLSTIKPLISGPIDKALSHLVGSPTEWERINAMKLSRETVTPPSRRVIFGEVLADNAAFAEGVSRYVTNMILCSLTLRYVSVGRLRRLILYLAHWKQRRDLPPVVKPLSALIAERRRTTALEGAGDDDVNKPFDCVQWAMDQAVSEEKKTPESIAKRLIVINAATSATIVAAMGNLLFDLASHPECVADLRAEIEQCLAEEHGVWSSTAMAKMKMLESFIQESMRMNGGLLSFSAWRLVTSETFRFDETLTFPKGTTLAFPSLSATNDPGIYPDPARFDPLRFYRIREENRPTDSDTRMQWLGFGYGRQACPGKFYALSILKTALGEIMLRYDVRYAGGPRARPETVDLDPLILPDPSVDLELRVRA